MHLRSFGYFAAAHRCSHWHHTFSALLRVTHFASWIGFIVELSSSRKRATPKPLQLEGSIYYYYIFFLVLIDLFIEIYKYCDATFTLVATSVDYELTDLFICKDGIAIANSDAATAISATASGAGAAESSTFSIGATDSPAILTESSAGARTVPVGPELGAGPFDSPRCKSRADRVQRARHRRRVAC